MEIVTFSHFSDVMSGHSFHDVINHNAWLSERSEEVVQVYGFCIRTLRFPVISVMIIGIMRLSYNERAVIRRQISAPSVPSCVHANDLSFKIHVFQVVKGPHSCRDRCYCSRWYVRML